MVLAQPNNHMGYGIIVMVSFYLAMAILSLYAASVGSFGFLGAEAIGCTVYGPYSVSVFVPVLLLIVASHSLALFAAIVSFKRCFPVVCSEVSAVGNIATFLTPRASTMFSLIALLEFLRWLFFSALAAFKNHIFSPNAPAHRLAESGEIANRQTEAIDLYESPDSRIAYHDPLTLRKGFSWAF